ncbi:hypothetical protein ATSB10_07370 [Dyella thiooxydans]|uniref:DUF3293 domain-containing protein n=1 Tax=Dyella thiooxydans TaxID=445710 RepID=A0A160MY04_9GAMM|nr:DUF3293 domain-containing protein [Dyella thiooxydans]AND68191.1 hypothetical protein ATSB10_07370 [Dyella thiooxydans]
MDERLLVAYRRTDYRVRLPGGGTTSLHVDTPVPATLHALVGTSPWGFITAWHPGSRRAPRDTNRQAQRRLLAELLADPATRAILAAVGVGADGWREPSLFAIGTPHVVLERLAAAFGQRAFLAGSGQGLARLVWTPQLTWVNGDS